MAFEGANRLLLNPALPLGGHKPPNYLVRKNRGLTTWGANAYYAIRPHRSKGTAAPPCEVVPFSPTSLRAQGTPATRATLNRCLRRTRPSMIG